MKTPKEKVKVVVPWHNPHQIEKFRHEWEISGDHPDVIFQRDTTKAGCALTKNAGIENAMAQGADIIIILDDDCFPNSGRYTISDLIGDHVAALQPVDGPLFKIVTDPPSRGTPYFNRTVKIEVAASMGFWTHVGDYDAPGQLVHGALKPMVFDRSIIMGQYFPLCGMNLAFRSSEYPWCKFVNVPRFDDIWQGFIWQRKAYLQNKCFNLAGPLVRHSRQSDVWQNLLDEAPSMKRNETLWQEILAIPACDMSVHAEVLFKLGLSC
jgi:hypothetical protein